MNTQTHLCVEGKGLAGNDLVACRTLSRTFVARQTMRQLPGFLMRSRYACFGLAYLHHGDRHTTRSVVTALFPISVTV